MDFTISKYKKLIKSLLKQGYTFQSFEEYLNSDLKKVVLLRHDVDLLPYNSLIFAEIQAEQGIKGSYYFRAVPESWNESIIKKILSLCFQCFDKDPDLIVHVRRHRGVMFSLLIVNERKL